METAKTPAYRNKTSRVSLLAGVLQVIFWVLLGLFIRSDFGWHAETLVFYITTIGLSFIIVIATGTAITAGIVSLVQIKESGETGKGSAITGLILGAIGVLPLLYIIFNYLYYKLFVY